MDNPSTNQFKPPPNSRVATATPAIFVVPTEDSKANEPILCGHCNVATKDATDRHLVGNIHNIQAPAKIYCGTCFERACKKPTTLRVRREANDDAPTAQAPSAHQQPQHQVPMAPPPVPPHASISARGATVNREQIRMSVNQAQRKGADIRQRQATPLPQVTTQVAASPLVPSNIPAEELASAFATIFAASNPLLAQQLARSLPAASQATSPGVAQPQKPAGIFQAAIGYTPNHAQHASEAKKHAQMAYASGNSEKVDVLVQFIREKAGGGGGMKPKTELIKNISEGRSVSAWMKPAELCSLVTTSLGPKVTKALAGFHIDWARFTVRDTNKWIDIGAADPNRPYFYDEVMVPDKKTEHRSFKKPTKPFYISLVMSPGHWTEFEQFEAEVELKALQQASGDQPTPVTSAKRARSLSPDIEETGAFKRPATPKTPPRFTSQANTPGNSDNYRSPDYSRMGSALKRAGAYGSSATGEDTHLYEPAREVQFWPIPVIPLKLLLEDDSKNRFFLNPMASTTGSLIVMKTTYAQGACKTAHHARMTLFSPSPNALGSSSHQNVLAKRMFMELDKKRQPKRYTFISERDEVVREANLLYLSTSLMEYTYNWIKKTIESRGGEQCPYKIFDFKFVVAGVAVTEQATIKEDGASKMKLIPQTAYLIEEVIPGGKGAFIKYIHNASARPLPEEYEEGYQEAVFLCFIQHAQYFRTGKLVYIADFQGAGNLLTDPQVITAPELGDTLFGDGNISESFEDFPDQHVCNKWCRWFGLEPLVPLFTKDVDEEGADKL